MEPRIQYAKTSDGVSIAYCTLGEGAPLVCMPQFPLCHIQREWQIPIQRHFYERLAQTRRLVLYDARGSGSSDRDVTALSLDAHVLDLEAIVERLQLDQFALIGRNSSAFVAISAAARRPERVSRLVLVAPFARGVDRYGAPVGRALLALRDVDWTILTDTAVHLVLGWDIGEEGRRLGAFARECVSRDIFLATMSASDEFDVTALLADVRAPTLVLPPFGPVPPIELVRDVASRIPDARLVAVERTPGASVLDDVQAVVRRAEAIEEFLAEGELSATPAATQPPPSAFRTVLFTDLVGHAGMMSRLGDERGRAVLREHERITRAVLKANGGAEVKTLGDGFMASFGSVTRTVECAIALQRAFAEREGEPLSIRIGLNAGEPIEEEGPDGRSDLFGATVILAARIAAQAQGGEILASLAVRELCAGKGFLFADTGEVTLKGFEEPVRLFAVRWREDA